MNQSIIKTWWLFLMLLAAARPAAGAAQAAASKEYQLKALFLLNFTQFVEWPATAFPDAGAPIVIGVLGNDPFGDVLDAVIRGETVKGRPLIVKRSRQIEELKSCHVLFISQSEKERIPAILAGLNEAPVLLVSEVEGFSRRGGIIGFCLHANKVRFEINAEAAKSRGLKISSQLLQLSVACP